MHQPVAQSRPRRIHALQHGLNQIRLRRVGQAMADQHDPKGHSPECQIGNEIGHSPSPWPRASFGKMVMPPIP